MRVFPRYSAARKQAVELQRVVLPCFRSRLLLGRVVDARLADSPYDLAAAALAESFLHDAPQQLDFPSVALQLALQLPVLGRERVCFLAQMLQLVRFAVATPLSRNPVLKFPVHQFIKSRWLLARALWLARWACFLLFLLAALLLPSLSPRYLERCVWQRSVALFQLFKLFLHWNVAGV